MYSTTAGGRYHKYAHYPQPFIFCAKSDSSGKAYTPWLVGASPTDNTGNPTDSSPYYLNSDIGRLPVFYSSTYKASSKIYKDLKMLPDEIKILVDSNLFLEIAGRITKYSDGRTPTLKGTCNLLLLNPPHMKQGNCIHMFHSVAIFSPRKGLFDEDPPEKQE